HAAGLLWHRAYAADRCTADHRRRAWGGGLVCSVRAAGLGHPGADCTGSASGCVGALPLRAKSDVRLPRCRHHRGCAAGRGLAALRLWHAVLVGLPRVRGWLRGACAATQLWRGVFYFLCQRPALDSASTAVAGTVTSVPWTIKPSRRPQVG